MAAANESDEWFDPMFHALYSCVKSSLDTHALLQDLVDSPRENNRTYKERIIFIDKLGSIECDPVELFHGLSDDILEAICVNGGFSAFNFVPFDVLCVNADGVGYSKSVIANSIFIITAELDRSIITGAGCDHYFSQAVLALCEWTHLLGAQYLRALGSHLSWLANANHGISDRTGLDVGDFDTAAAFVFNYLQCSAIKHAVADRNHSKLTPNHAWENLFAHYAAISNQNIKMYLNMYSST